MRAQRAKRTRRTRRRQGLARIRPLHFHEQVPRLHVARLAVIGDGGAQSLRPRAQLLVKFVAFLDVRKDLIGFGETSLWPIVAWCELWLSIYAAGVSTGRTWII